MDCEGFGDEETYLAKKLVSLLNELRRAETKVGASIAQSDYREAANAARDAQTTAVDALEAVLEVARWTPERPLKNIPVELIRQAEARLDFPEDTFARFFDVNSEMSRHRTYQLVSVLQQLLNRIRAQEIADEIHEVPTWLPKLVKVIGVVAVGTLIGAPLAALAVKESAIKELIKAGIGLTIAALTEWFVGPAVDSIFDGYDSSGPSVPSRPRPDPSSSDPSFPPHKTPKHDPTPPDVSDIFDIINREAPSSNLFDQDTNERPDDPDEPKRDGPSFGNI